MSRYIEPKRFHALGIVADALESQAKGCSYKVAESQVDQYSNHQRDKVKGCGITQHQAPHRWWLNPINAGVSIGEIVILFGEIENQHGLRQRNHEKIDTLGTHGNKGEDSRKQNGCNQRGANADIPGQTNSHREEPEGVSCRTVDPFERVRPYHYSLPERLNSKR